MINYLCMSDFDIVIPVKSDKEREAELLKQFGDWVRSLRVDSKLSRQQLADVTDMSLMAITYIENGKRWPRISNLEKIAKAVDVTLPEMLHSLK